MGVGGGHRKAFVPRSPTGSCWVSVRVFTDPIYVRCPVPLPPVSRGLRRVIKWHFCSSGHPSPNPLSFPRAVPTPDPQPTRPAGAPLLECQLPGQLLVTSCSWAEASAPAASLILVNAHINCLSWPLWSPTPACLASARPGRWRYWSG